MLLRILALSGYAITQFESDKLANEIVFRDDRQIIKINDSKEFFINPQESRTKAFLKKANVRL